MSEKKKIILISGARITQSTADRLQEFLKKREEDSSIDEILAIELPDNATLEIITIDVEDSGDPADHAIEIFAYRYPILCDLKDKEYS